MKPALTILNKEIRTSLRSVSTYIIFLLFLLITGTYFSLTAFKIGKADVRSLLSVIHLIYIFYIPALTMGVFSREQASGTLELLFTLPLRIRDVIMGKFWAMIILLMLVIAFTGVHLLTVLIFGMQVDIGALVTGYIGIIFVGAAYVSIGLFASCLQNNQVLSFMIGFFISLFFYVISQLTVVIPMDVLNVIKHISFDHHFQSFAKGVIDTRDVLFFLSVTAIFLLLTELKLKLRNRMMER